jgi:two-component system, OmpR family, sensor histidine kinase BaeS
LIANSLRHTPAGGQIRLRALAGEGEVIFQVADTGPGIEPAALPHIFERFYRADGARRREDGGSGLGLAIARSIVVAHNGRIWAARLSPAPDFVAALVAHPAPHLFAPTIVE